MEKSWRAPRQVHPSTPPLTGDCFAQRCTHHCCHFSTAPAPPAHSKLTSSALQPHAAGSAPPSWPHCQCGGSGTGAQPGCQYQLVGLSICGGHPPSGVHLGLLSHFVPASWAVVCGHRSPGFLPGANFLLLVNLHACRPAKGAFPGSAPRPGSVLPALPCLRPFFFCCHV